MYEIEGALRELQILYEIQVDFCIVTDLSSPPWDAICDSCSRTRRILSVEEGGKTSGFGSLIGSGIFERLSNVSRPLDIVFRSVAGPDAPLASSRHLESLQLPSRDDVIESILAIVGKNEGIRR